MDYRLYYSQKAISDLAEIIGRIAEDDDQAASSFGNSLLNHVELLSRFPRLGSSIPGKLGVRKLVHSPFLIYYQIHEKKGIVELLHVRHSARKPPRSELRSEMG
ncbi:MAG TPA: type II toxin-antitoxin system RelE/ParE family toxin [Candidatus Solibacter sp.]|nr:type II toxin-antitoxin system RelE/ParE family toxin [Candidatus Solibacter sp.]